jgi:hypothetical protein
VLQSVDLRSLKVSNPSVLDISHSENLHSTKSKMNSKFVGPGLGLTYENMYQIILPQLHQQTAFSHCSLNECVTFAIFS